MPRAPFHNQHDGANAAPMLIAGAPAGRWTPSGSLFARLSFSHSLYVFIWIRSIGGGAGDGSAATNGGT